MAVTFVFLGLAALAVNGAVVWGPHASVQPEDVGFNSADLKDAEKFISNHVLQRQCLVFAKDGQIVYETYSGLTPFVGVNHSFGGFSMTKSVGALLILYAASEGGLDLEADITESYGIASVKEYGITTQMILTQVISSDDAPGQTWEYDSLGNDWLYLLPFILHSATGRTASDWFAEFTQRLEFSNHFKWDNIDDPPPEGGWYTGAEGPCYDWARFGQVIASGGRWGDDQVISDQFIQLAGMPQKVAPFNYYSNPCWSHGFWMNADKEKYNGCCWEASRLPPPMCNEETFMPNAPTDLIMMLGLHGMVVAAVPSVNSVIVSMGDDLRPIEPVRIGVWPAFCSILGLGCNVPPPIPRAHCTETLQCDGMAAQCFAGNQPFSHEKPGRPAGEGCVKCFQQRVGTYAKTHPEAEDLLKKYCNWPHNSDLEQFQKFSNFVYCYCFLGDNPFKWPTTTTTTPAPSLDPLPPHLYTTTTRKPPLNHCNVKEACWASVLAACPGPWVPRQSPPTAIPSGCHMVLPGDVAPTAGIFTSDDDVVRNVPVLTGERANISGWFCPDGVEVASTLALPAPSLRGPVASASSVRPASGDEVNLSRESVSDADNRPLLLQRAAQLQSTPAPGIDRALVGKTVVDKCYLCMENAQDGLKDVLCPWKEFGWKSLMFCHCGIEVPGDSAVARV